MCLSQVSTLSALHYYPIKMNLARFLQLFKLLPLITHSFFTLNEETGIWKIYLVRVLDVYLRCFDYWLHVLTSSPSPTRTTYWTNYHGREVIFVWFIYSSKQRKWCFFPLALQNNHLHYADELRIKINVIFIYEYSFLKTWKKWINLIYLIISKEEKKYILE